MAYEISSSVAASTFSTQTVTSAVTNGFEHGGKFSPDGTKMAVSTYRHGGASSTDYGIDIYTSSSVGGWARTESIDATTAPGHLEWFSDNNIFSIQGAYVRNYVSSSASGWAAGQVVVATGGDYYMEFNPSKTILATWKGTDQYYRSIYSGSGNWTSSADLKGGNYGNLQSLAWISDDTVALGYPENSSYRGILLTYKTTNGGSSYSMAEYLNGDSVQLPGMGASLYYHTASNSLLVGTRDGAGEGAHADNKLVLFQSGSEGHLPVSYTSHTVIDSGKRVYKGHHTAIQHGNGDRILMVTHDDGADDADLVAIESGSAGWKVTVIDGDIRDPGTNGNLDISSLGAVASNDTTAGTGQATFLVRQMIASNPALATSVTTSVGSGGGTVKAGGTAAAPTITITVPSSALSGDTSLTAAVVSTAATKRVALQDIKAQAGSAGGVLVGDIFRLTPHGQQFSSAATVQFVLDSEPSDLTIWKRDSHDGDFTQWYELPAGLWSNSGTTVTISTTKFSEYAGIGGINVARTKISNGQLATLTSSDLIDSSALRVSGSNSFKNLTVAAADLFVIEQGGGTYHISASQMAEYFGGLVTVSASSDNSDMRMTFVSPADNNDIGLAVDAGIKYNPSSNTLKGTNLSGSGALTIAGNSDIAGTLDVVGLISGSGGIDIAGTADFGAAVNVQGALDVDGATTLDGLTVAEAAIFSSTLSATGLISGSGGIDIAGAADFGATVNVQGILSGSGDLTIAGSATIDDNIVATKGYIQVAAGGLFVTGAIGLKASNGADAVISTDGGGEIRMDASTNIEIGGVNGTPKIGRSSMTSQVLGHLSGAGNFSLAGNATIDDNIVTTKGYIQVVAGNVHVTGNVLAQQIKGTAISGSGNLTIAGNATVAGNFTVNGDLTYINTTNLAVEDSLILLGSGSTGTPVNDQGIILERGSADNAAMIWDESTDRFVFANVGSASAGSTGNLTYSAYPVSASVFHGDGSGLTNVGAEVVAAAKNNLDLQLTFASGAASAGAFFINSGSLMYNPSTNGLKASALEPTGSETFRLGRSGENHRITLNSSALILSTPSGTGKSVEYYNNGFKAGEIEVYTDSGNAHTMKMKTTARLALSGGLGTFISGNLGLRLDGPISGSGHLQVAGDTDLAGTLDVVGLISGSGGMDIAGTADFGAAVNIQGALDVDGATTLDGLTVAEAAIFSSTVSVTGLISGSGGVDIAGAADFGAAVNIQGLLSGSGGMDMAGTADFGAAVNVQGLLSGSGGMDMAGAADFGATVGVQGAVTLSDSSALAIDTNDATHFFLVTDSNDSIVKRESVTDFVQHITGAAGTKGGLQVHQGKLYIAQKEESFMSASLTGHAHTASISSAVLSGSMMVFLNGLLQTRSGSANLGAGANSIFDYRLDSYTAPTKVLMADALDSDDVLIVRYIQK